MNGFYITLLPLKMFNQLLRIIWTGVSQIVVDMEEVYVFHIALCMPTDMHHVHRVDH